MSIGGIVTSEEKLIKVSCDKMQPTFIWGQFACMSASFIAPAGY
jgi:hypothetical protein